MVKFYKVVTTRTTRKGGGEKGEGSTSYVRTLVQKVIQIELWVTM